MQKDIYFKQVYEARLKQGRRAVGKVRRKQGSKEARQAMSTCFRLCSNVYCIFVQLKCSVFQLSDRESFVEPTALRHVGSEFSLLPGPPSDPQFDRIPTAAWRDDRHPSSMSALL